MSRNHQSLTILLRVLSAGYKRTREKFTDCKLSIESSRRPGETNPLQHIAAVAYSSGLTPNFGLQKWEMRGRGEGSTSIVQELCHLFFLWFERKHYFDPISADSAWQRQFRLL